MSPRSRTVLADSRSGFTIVEFMIATTVFSVILLGVTAAILHISRTYQHSLYASSTQAAANTVVDTVSQAIKFSAGQVTERVDPNNSGTQALCVGNRQFLFVVGRQLGSTDPETGTDHAVVTRQNQNSSCADIPSIISGPVAGSPKELLGNNMRLVRLTVNDPMPADPNMYVIHAKVAYGDDDLFCSDSVLGSCASTAAMNLEQLKSPDLMCRPNDGARFCAVSELSVSVYRRL